MWASIRILTRGHTRHEDFDPFGDWHNDAQTIDHDDAASRRTGTCSPAQASTETRAAVATPAQSSRYATDESATRSARAEPLIRH